MHFAAVPFSGSSVNPARTFGPALIGNEWTGIWIYFIAPPLGAVLAWLVYTVVVKGDTDIRDDVQALRQGDGPTASERASERPDRLAVRLRRRSGRNPSGGLHQLFSIR